MVKPRPKFLWRRNRLSSLRKSEHKIPKGVILVQASFHNTIVNVTDVGGQVVLWDFASTCGFRGAKRGTAFAAQTMAGSAIRTSVKQSMQEAKVDYTKPMSILPL